MYLVYVCTCTYICVACIGMPMYMCTYNIDIYAPHILCMHDVDTRSWSRSRMIYRCAYMHVASMYVTVCVVLGSEFIKLIAFELAAKFSRRRENPVQQRLCNVKNAIFKRLKTGFALRTRSSPAISNAISFTHLFTMHSR
jgi:hypothetical protein